MWYPVSLAKRRINSLDSNERVAYSLDSAGGPVGSIFELWHRIRLKIYSTAYEPTD